MRSAVSVRQHLDLSDVSRGMMQFWLGHADKTITDRYVKMQGRIKERQTWAEKGRPRLQAAAGVERQSREERLA